MVIGAVLHSERPQSQVFLGVADLAVDSASVADWPFLPKGFQLPGKIAKVFLVLAGGIRDIVQVVLDARIAALDEGQHFVE